MSEAIHEAGAARVVSVARVATDRAGRYGKQLAAHMGRKVPFTWDAGTDTGTVSFADGAVRAVLRGEPDALVLELDAASADVATFEDVLGRHLVRFGARDALACAWQRSDGTPGTRQVAPADGE